MKEEDVKENKEFQFKQAGLYGELKDEDSKY